MGIPKLKQFMSRNKDCWSTVQVREKIVIDGTSLCYTLNSQHEWRHGGDYSEFYCTVTEYFRQLLALGIEPYVVMDGMDPDDSKYDTYIKRNEERINNIASCQFQDTSPKKSVRPLFTLTVFMDALRDMRINFLVADGEADRDIASLANNLSSPVLSNDSDFFIFNIHAGYIPLESELPVDFKEPVNCFKFENFDAKLSLNNDQRLYIPFIAGNDRYSGISLPKIGLRWNAQIRTIIEKIRNAGLTCKSDQEVQPYTGWSGVERMSKIRSYYRVEPRSFENLASTMKLAELYPKTPTWILEEYKRGCFMPPVMSLATCPIKRWRHTIVIEDFSQESAWSITGVSKKFIIGAILGAEGRQLEITKTVVKKSDTDTRGSLSLTDEKIKLVSKHLNILPVPLGDISTLPVSNRREIMLRVFHYKASTEFPESYHLALIASHCWMNNLKPRGANLQQLAETLVCTILTCQGHLQPPTNYHAPQLPREELLALIHSCAQWQCMLHHVIAFSQVLGHPFPYTSPAKLFSSKVMLHFYQKEAERSASVTSDTLAKNMLHAISDRAQKRLLPEDMQTADRPPPKKRQLN